MTRSMMKESELWTDKPCSSRIIVQHQFGQLFPLLQDVWNVHLQKKINPQNTVRMIKKYNFDKAFIAANGLTINKGATNSDDGEHEIKCRAVSQSKFKILLVDDTKFDRSGLETFANIKDFTHIITNKEPSKEYIEHCKKHNVELIY